MEVKMDCEWIFWEGKLNKKTIGDFYYYEDHIKKIHLFRLQLVNITMFQSIKRILRSKIFFYNNPW
jgi:hypothetical protein